MNNLKYKILLIVLITIGAYFYYSNKYEELQNVQNEITIEQEVGESQLSPPISFPVHGTIFLDSNIISYDDPSTFQTVTDAGKGMRNMFDRRVNEFTDTEAFLFNAIFDDGLKAEIQVNVEFQNVDAARLEAQKYAYEIGKLPTALRTELETVWIHKGKELYGGGNNNILIHTEQTIEYERDGILEETLVHEAAHTSLDPFYENSPAWLKCQKLDGKYISNYAEENPNREDIAETFLLYLAARHKSDRISQALRDSILAQVPNRIIFFDSLNLDMYPIEEVVLK
ncbi:MAG: hypothetical protein AB8H03_15140 [Saprospiraceae bacterium]